MEGRGHWPLYSSGMTRIRLFSRADEPRESRIPDESRLDCDKHFPLPFATGQASVLTHGEKDRLCNAGNRYHSSKHAQLSSTCLIVLLQSSAKRTMLLPLSGMRRHGCLRQRHTGQAHSSQIDHVPIIQKPAGLLRKCLLVLLRKSSKLTARLLTLLHHVQATRPLGRSSSTWIQFSRPSGTAALRLRLDCPQ